MSILSLLCMLSMCVSKDNRMVIRKGIVASFLQCLVAFLGFHVSCDLLPSAARPIILTYGHPNLSWRLYIYILRTYGSPGLSVTLPWPHVFEMAPQ